MGTQQHLDTKERNSDEFDITMPEEDRQEDRVPWAHTHSEWKFKCLDYNNRCAYCGQHKNKTREKYLTRDHIVPVRWNGTDHISNIVPACVECNKRKSYFLPGQVNRDGSVVPHPKPRLRLRRW